MRIAQAAPPFKSVPPTRYGGERVVSTLTGHLGHDLHPRVVRLLCHRERFAAKHDVLPDETRRISC